MVNIGAFVHKVGVIGGDIEAMGKPRWNPEHFLVFGAEANPEPLPKSGGMASEVHCDIEHLTGRHPHQFALGMFSLKVQPSQYAMG